MHESEANPPNNQAAALMLVQKLEEERQRLHQEIERINTELHAALKNSTQGSETTDNG